MTKDQYDIQSYKDAVWDFVLEHCDVLDSGTLFVKFHIKDRRNLENRILSRWKFGYHREDVRAKEAGADQKRQAKIKREYDKRKRYEKNRRRGMYKLTVQKVLKLITFGAFGFQKGDSRVQRSKKTL